MKLGLQSQGCWEKALDPKICRNIFPPFLYNAYQSHVPDLHFILLFFTTHPENTPLIKFTSRIIRIYIGFSSFSQNKHVEMKFRHFNNLSKFYKIIRRKVQKHRLPKETKESPAFEVSSEDDSVNNAVLHEKLIHELEEERHLRLQSEKRLQEVTLESEHNRIQMRGLQQQFSRSSVNQMPIPYRFKLHKRRLHPRLKEKIIMYTINSDKSHDFSAPVLTFSPGTVIRCLEAISLLTVMGILLSQLIAVLKCSLLYAELQGVVNGD
ncbi:hypothetical protein P7K49_014197, partial [Saguinus oedipus]